MYLATYSISDKLLTRLAVLTRNEKHGGPGGGVEGWRGGFILLYNNNLSSLVCSLFWAENRRRGCWATKKKKKKKIAVILVKFASFGSKMGDIPLNWRRWSVLPAYLASCMYIYVIYDILNLPTYL